MVPLRSRTIEQPQHPTYTRHVANSIHHMANQKNLIGYLRQLFFSQPASTLLKAIKFFQLLGVPGFTPKAITKWLPGSTATIKGHMNRTQNNLCATQQHIAITKEKMNPTEKNECYH